MNAPCGGVETKARIPNHYTSTVLQPSQLDPITRRSKVKSLFEMSRNALQGTNSEL